MPEIVTRGTRGSELSYQIGDEQIANSVIRITTNTNLDSTHNRNTLVVTSGVSLVLPAYATLEASLDAVDTSGEKVGWIVDVIPDSSNNITIDATTNSQILNGISNDIVVSAYEIVRITYYPTGNVYYLTRINKVYAGSIHGTDPAGSSDLPVGFSASKSSTGVYVLTHSLGTTDFSITVSPISTNASMATISSKGINTITVSTFNSSGTASDIGTDLILSKN